MDYIVKRYKDWRLYSQFVQIGTDMDDDCFFNGEKQSIRDSGRSLKKYGSTCNHVRNNEQLIRHELNKTDTLQGIALKYGCSTEQIRRSNRLFAQDSLFLRQFLMIPVDKDSPYYPKDDRPQSLPTYSASSSSSHNSVDTVDAAHMGSPSSAGGTTGAKSLEAIPQPVLSPEEENRKDIDAFLGKIDSTLAQTRKYVAKSQSSFDEYINSPTSSDDPFASRRFHMSTSSSNSSSSHHHHQRNRSTGSNASASNNNDTMQLLTISNGRRVQSSLQRLEKQQDEFFEL